MTILGAVEAGGTKFVCAVGDAAGSRERAVIATRDVETTLGEVAAFFDSAAIRSGPAAAFGVGSFGPLELDPTSPGYGRITTTPKPGWRDVDVPGWLRARYSVPVAIDTDVNAAALAEARARGKARLAYVTVGTGIGVGLVADGRTAAGFGHPEAGHILVRRGEAHVGFNGVCPFHGDCLEGLASGPAISAAWDASLGELAHDHPAWALEASYLGQLCATLVLTFAPDCIVLGGGVMRQARLMPMVRAATLSTLAGYCSRWDAPAAEDRIVASSSAEPAGLVGAFLLAQDLLSSVGRVEPVR